MTTMERKLSELTAEIESRLHDVEPEVKVLQVQPTGPESLRLFIDHPSGVDLALCERVTRHLDELRRTWSLEVSSPGPKFRRKSESQGAASAESVSDSGGSASPSHVRAESVSDSGGSANLRRTK